MKQIVIIGLIIFGGFFLSPAQTVIEIADTGWRLWPDTVAAWENDSLYLPNEIHLERLPVNAPTGGWLLLNNSTGIEITLPTTVEEHFWGAFGYRDYGTDCYFQSGIDQAKNGNYRGVSWWWRTVDLPANLKGKKLILHIRGARLRAEVYWNRQLVGYHIITETSFTCDITPAARPGETNLLAIRITNPGGQMDWMDTRYLQWGEYRFHSSHGFGGLDRGLFISAHDPVYLEDAWVLNTPEVRAVMAYARLKNDSPFPVNGFINFRIFHPRRPGEVLLQRRQEFSLEARRDTVVECRLHYPEAKLWDLENPNLYLMECSLRCPSPGGSGVWRDEQRKTFGFRWFEAEGIGKSAILRLNGRRIRLVSAISWGFWGLNGLWPTPESAEREVLAAKNFGMNCIQFHRNIGKAEVLDAQDRLGLLRFMEPGGGQQALGETYKLYAPSPTDSLNTSGRGGEPRSFAEKYMEEKIIRMIRDHRSHPSLIIYNIQNEIHPDLKNPRIYHLLRRMHREDPSRIITLKSGIPPRNQAWMQPYDETVYHDDGTGYSGWWDQHTVGGPGVWQDGLYKNPRDFTHRSVNDSEIVVWGEMLGAAVPDNHARMIREIEAAGGKAYDLQDHREILQAYDQFLDRWDFRRAFPHSEELFLSIGNKCYDFWGRVIETARLAEANDFLVISGWESTAIENHSGLLDNLRGVKGDPRLISTRLALLRPVIKARSLVINKNEPAILDLFLLNETHQLHGEQATLTLFTPGNNAVTLGQFKIPRWEKDRFVYPIIDSLYTTKFSEEGWYRLQLSIEGAPGIAAEESLLVVEAFPDPGRILKVGVAIHEPEFIEQLNRLPGIQAVPYQTGGHYDILLCSTRLLYGWRSEVDSSTEILNTEDDVLFHTESWGYWRNLEYVFDKLPPGRAKVTLRFAEVTLKHPGDRIMNVAINGDTVLKDFDIVATVGGPNIALDTTFIVEAPRGVVKITVPKLTVNYAKFSAIKVEAGDTVIAINCGGEDYVDKNGLVWKKYRADLNLNEKILELVRQGTPLLLLPDGWEAAEAYAQKLGEAAAFDYRGHVGNTRTSWMGSWFFLKAHPVFEGLPQNQAMRSYYQVPVGGSDGILLEGEKVNVFIGYGRDHDRNIGAAGFEAPLGKGRVLFYSLPGMISGLINSSGGGMHPVILKRLLANSLKYLVQN
ncbi:MAG: hypothetical protein Kow0042_07300 [Calditrichia bacterium]